MDVVKAPMPIERVAARLRHLRPGLAAVSGDRPASSDLGCPLFTQDRYLHETATNLGVPPSPAPVTGHWDTDTRAELEAVLADAGLDAGEPAA